MRPFYARNMAIINDQLETDIRGALSFEIHAVLIETVVIAKGLQAVTANLGPTYRLISLLA